MKRSIGQNTASFVLLLALVLSMTLVAQQPVAKAAGTWGTAASITDGSSHAVSPDVAIDSQGVAHVVWYNSDFSSFSTVFYSNNRGGSWSTPTQVFTGYTFSDYPRVSTVTIGGQVHVGIAARGRTGDIFATRIVYRGSTDGGVTWAPQEVVSTVTSFEPDVVLDDTGQPHVSYTEYQNDTFAVYYRTRVSGTWGTRTLVGTTSNTYHNYSTIAYTRVGGELGLHVMFMANTDTELSKTIYYTKKIGTAAWTSPKLVLGNGSNFPDLEADPATGHLYAALQGFTSDFEAYSAISTDLGGTWTLVAQSQTTGLDARPGIGRTPTNELAIAWDTNFQSSNGAIDARVFEAGVWGARQRLINTPGISKEVEVGGGPGGFMAVWHDAEQGNFRIYYNTYAVTSGASVVPVIEGGIAVTGKTTNLSVLLTAQEGDPTEVRYAWGAAPTDANSWVTIPDNDTITVTGPTPITTTACLAYTLYVQARAGTNPAGLAKTDSIIIDDGVQSTVSIKSPLTSPTSGKAPNAGDAVSYPVAGHPDFMRTSQIQYKVSDETSGCAGVSNFVSQRGPVYANSTDLGQNKYITLSTSGWTAEGVNSDGTTNYAEHDETVSVTVTDKLTDTTPNTSVFTKVLHYDDDPPVLTSSSGMAATNNDGESGFATVYITNVTVTDDSYGQYVDNSNKAYWGIWVLLKGTAVVSPTGLDFATGNALPYSIEEGATSVQIDLTQGGLGPGPGAGSRFIYVRFLDGAGNFSNEVVQLQLPLNEGYGTSPIFLPFVRR